MATTTEVKEFLETGHKLARELEALSNYEQELFEKGTRITQTSLDRETRTSGIPRHVEQAATLLADLHQDIEVKMEENRKQHEAVKKAIELVDDPELRAILYYRYLLGLNWEDICEKMNYSWNTIHRKHQKSLCFLSKIEEEHPPSRWLS